MSEDCWFPEQYDHDDIEELYNELQQDLIDTAKKESDGKPTKNNIWEIIIREGLYQNLVEHPHIGFGFLLSTTHGPTREYKEYLNLASNFDEVVILVALSALVNDTSHQTSDYVYDVILGETQEVSGNIADTDHSEKLEHVHRFQSDVDSTIPQLDILIAKAARSKENNGLFDRPLIDLLNKEENLQFVFKSEYYGFSAMDGDMEINPTENGCAYHLITSERLLSAVGRIDDPDMLLSIPLAVIEECEIHQGWTKNRIEITTSLTKDNGPYNIWVSGFQENHTKSDIRAALLD